MRRTAIVFEAEDATSFAASAAGSERVIAATPVARMALEDANIPAASSDEVYSDRSHARVNVRLKRARRAMSALLSGRGLDSAAAEMLLVLASEVASSSAAMWELLRGPGPWLVRDGKSWRECEARVDAHRALMEASAGTYRSREQSRFRGRVLPGAWLARAVFAAATRLRNGRDVVLLHEMRRGLDRLVDLIEADGTVDVLALGYAPKSWRVFAKQAFSVARGQGGGSTLLPPLREDRATAATVAGILAGYTADAVVARGLAAFADLIAQSCAQVAALNQDLAPALRRLRARSIVIWDSISPKTIAASHAGRLAGARVFAAGHAAASLHCEEAGRPFAEFRVAGMTVGQAVDEIFAQSPTIAAAAARVAPHVPQIPAHPFLWRDPPKRGPLPADAPALFLWAGNFGRWMKHRPWIEETPDEMVAALVRFAEAVVATPEARLEARIKPNWRNKGDVNFAALKRRLPKHDRIVVTADGSFGDSLAQATAVVTHASTAFEESLRARVPVVLWGARGRSHFVRGCDTPPSGNDRAAVYAPDWTCDLPAFLTAIARAHRRQPLTDAECKDLVWTEEAANLGAVAAAIARPRVPSVADPAC